MVNTLRITSVLAVALAITLISFSAVYGFKEDPKVDELLATPTIIEQLEKVQSTRTQPSDAQQSPLVIQAGLFARYLDPPPLPKTESGTIIRNTGTPPPPPPPTAKFSVVGLSYCSTNPNLSRALIDEPGDGMRWVRLQDIIGHQTVREITERGLVLSDGQAVVKIEQPKLSLVVREGETRSTASMAAPLRITARGGNAKVVTPKPQIPRPTSPVSVRPSLSNPSLSRLPRDSRATEEIELQMEAIRELNAKGEDLTEEEKLERKELLESFTNRMRGSSRLNLNETRNLDRMGRELDPNISDTPD